MWVDVGCCGATGNTKVAPLAVFLYVLDVGGCGWCDLLDPKNIQDIQVSKGMLLAS